mmetsp:Transcript_36858/g.115421  ORF Transcript_36858/g.115421 Transcript_36858/m.115421 type:complete len:124 (-) Transcript_36858:15-386(-)
MKSRGVCVLVLLIATWIASVCCSCWQPTRIVQAMCSSAENNTFPTYQLLQQQYSGARRLLWQGGGPASEDIPDHILSEQARFRGDGGTILTYKGQSIPQRKEACILAFLVHCDSYQPDHLTGT